MPHKQSTPRFSPTTVFFFFFFQNLSRIHTTFTEKPVKHGEWKKVVTSLLFMVRVAVVVGNLKGRYVSDHNLPKSDVLAMTMTINPNMHVTVWVSRWLTHDTSYHCTSFPLDSTVDTSYHCTSFPLDSTVIIIGVRYCLIHPHFPCLSQL